MSYIYEALKRVEHEREHGAVTVRTVAGPLVFATRARWWVWVLIGGLVVNAALLGVLAVDRWRRPPPAPAPAPAAAVVVPAPVPVAPPRVVMAPPTVRSPAVVATPSVAAPKKPPQVASERPPATATPPRTDEPEPLAVATPAPAEPRVSIAPAPAVTPAPAAPTTPERAPDLTLQVHVYSLVASERMVFIAGRRYAEGDAIDEDTVVERITPDGAVVRRRGERFELSGRRP